ncbi:MAG: hypothetical protein JO227_03675 [Acetobacteraceae bacterium]|nr:hypothetical protein [Acetobacteraceae bacterium]
MALQSLLHPRTVKHWFGARGRRLASTIYLGPSSLATKDDIDQLWAEFSKVRAELAKSVAPQPIQPFLAEDIRKIHSEINQIVNQRFLVTTAAITVFGVVFSQMIPKEFAHTRESMPLILIEEVLLLTILFTLFYLSLLLRNSLRLFATYLVAKGVSAWESDWKKLRSNSRIYLYTHSYTYMFMLLGLLTMATPVLIEWNARILSKGQFGLILGLLAGGCYLALVWVLARRTRSSSREEDLLKKWKGVVGVP